MILTVWSSLGSINSPLHHIVYWPPPDSISLSVQYRLLVMNCLDSCLDTVKSGYLHIVLIRKFDRFRGPSVLVHTRHRSSLHTVLVDGKESAKTSPRLRIVGSSFLKSLCAIKVSIIVSNVMPTIMIHWFRHSSFMDEYQSFDLSFKNQARALILDHTGSGRGLRSMSCNSKS